jgi:hypothetical protein
MIGGLGLITSSNFYVPQVNLPGSMATFVLPAAIPVAAPVCSATGMDTKVSTSGGLGQTPTAAFGLPSLGLPAGFFGDQPGGGLFPQGVITGWVNFYWPYLAGGAVLLALLMSKK